MSTIIGKVLDKASTDFFYFVSSGYYSADFVEVNADHINSGAKIIGEIIGRESFNPYFEKPTDLRYVDSNDEQVAERSLFLSRVRTIAIIDGGKKIDISFPPKPSTNVIKATQDDIRIALGISDVGINIGTLLGYDDLPFKISASQLLRTHIAILGQTGSGKSYYTAKLSVELIKFRKRIDMPSTAAVPIVFDSSGEYSSLENKDQNQLGLVMPIINSKEHYFPFLNQRYLPLLSEIYELNDREESVLKPWLGYESDYQAKESSQTTITEVENSNIKELIQQFNQVRVSSTVQFANTIEDILKAQNKYPGDERFTILYSALNKLRKLNIRIRKTADADVIDNLSGGLIINLSDYENYDERQIAMLLFLRQLYEIARSKNKATKMILFIDEAHNYVPSVYKSFCKSEILRIAREGRKYGLTLCLISQRPRWVDPTALSQCGNVFIFRIQNSDDKKHIFDSVSLPDSIKELNIARLKTGEMLVSGDLVDHAISCKVTKIDEGFIKSQQKQSAAKHLKEIREKLA
jgi:hypothetical protein